MQIFDIFTLFWRRYPGLLLGLFITLSALVSFGNFLSLIPLLLIFIVMPKKYLFHFLALFIALFLWIKIAYKLPDQKIEGEGRFSIHTVTKAQRGWIYRGTVHSLRQDGKVVAKRVPISFFSFREEKSDGIYSAPCEIEKKRGYNYRFKPKGKWIKEKSKIDWARLRYKAKEKIASKLRSEIPQKKAASLIVALATAELKDPILGKEFERNGLSHLLAISGFHFAIVALSLSFFFRPFFPHRGQLIALATLLSLYFLFIGSTASIERAWIVALVYLASQIFERRATGLNSLGIALFISVALNPYIAMSLGFQLSFLATGGILLLYRPLENFLRTLFPKEPYQGLLAQSFLKQHLAIVSGIFRRSLALNFAVHVALLPLLFHVFHKFPLHSLFYNLFFPFLITGTLILLIFSFIPFINSLNGFYTEGILKLLEPPLFPRVTLFLEGEYPLLVVLYLSSLFILGVLVNSHLEDKNKLIAFNTKY